MSDSEQTFPLVLEWVETRRKRTKTLFAYQREEKRDYALIGRDADKCDLVINDPSNSISRVHAEIIYRASENRYFLLNCTRDRATPNPIVVDGKLVVFEEVPISQGMQIQLGKSVVLYVKYIARANEKEIPKYGLECPHCKRILSHQNLSTLSRQTRAFINHFLYS